MSTGYLIKRASLNNIPSNERLLKAYSTLCKTLNKVNIYKCAPTNREREFFEKAENQLKLKVHRSVWISKFSIDVFIPAVKQTNGLHGLVVEVNGDVHNFELKMRKDEKKAEFLHKFRIGVLAVENQDVRLLRTSSLINNIRQTQRPDSREKQRLWRKIYVSTLIANRNLIDLQSFFTQKEIQALKKYSKRL